MLFPQTAPVFAAAEKEHAPAVSGEAPEENAFRSSAYPTYSSYHDRYAGEKRPDAEILVRGKDYRKARTDEPGAVRVGSIGSEYGQENRDDVLIWNTDEGTLTYEVTVPETGCWCMAFSYLPIPSHMASIEFAVTIDGEIPYDTASRASLNKVYESDGEIRCDSRGNQMRPAQHQTGLWCETALLDADGLFNDPLCFYLEKGTHEIGFTFEKGWLALDSFKLYNPAPLPSYADYRRSAEGTASDTLIRLEGENAAYKSSATLYPTEDNASYLASPSDPGKTVYNTIGAGSWKKAMQTITWVIPAEEIPADSAPTAGCIWTGECRVRSWIRSDSGTIPSGRMSFPKMKTGSRWSSTSQSDSSTS